MVSPVGLDDDWGTDGDSARLDRRAVDTKAELALIGDRAQDRRIAPRRHRIDVDHDASLVAPIDAHPHAVTIAGRDIRRVADHFVTDEATLSMEFQDGHVVIRTKDPGSFYQRLNDLIVSDGVQVAAFAPRAVHTPCRLRPSRWAKCGRSMDFA